MPKMSCYHNLKKYLQNICQVSEMNKKTVSKVQNLQKLPKTNPTKFDIFRQSSKNIINQSSLTEQLRKGYISKLQHHHQDCKPSPL